MQGYSGLGQSTQSSSRMASGTRPSLLLSPVSRCPPTPVPARCPLNACEPEPEGPLSSCGWSCCNIHMMIPYISLITTRHFKCVYICPETFSSRLYKIVLIYPEAFLE